MGNYKAHFGGNTLKTEDLGGHEHALTVERVYEHTFEGRDGKPDEVKLVVKFVGKNKIMVLNLTNADSLAELSGSDDFDDWAGTKVVLYPTTTRFGSDMVPCMRMKRGEPWESSRPATTPTPAPPDSSEIPF